MPVSEIDAALVIPPLAPVNSHRKPTFGIGSPKTFDATAVSCSCSPWRISALGDRTSTRAGSTSMDMVLRSGPTPPAIVAVPRPTPVATPEESTVMMDGFEEVHVKVSSGRARPAPSRVLAEIRICSPAAIRVRSAVSDIVLAGPCALATEIANSKRLTARSACPQIRPALIRIPLQWAHTGPEWRRARIRISYRRAYLQYSLSSRFREPNKRCKRYLP